MNAIERIQNKLEAALIVLNADYPDGPLETPAYLYRMGLVADYATQLNEARRMVACPVCHGFGGPASGDADSDGACCRSCGA